MVLALQLCGSLPSTGQLLDWVARVASLERFESWTLVGTPASGHPVTSDEAGNVYVCGTIWSGVSDDLMVLKYSAGGALVWARVHDGPAHWGERAKAIAVDGNGNVLVAGETYAEVGHYNFYVIKYDSMGDELWTASYSSPGNQADTVSDVDVDGNGNVYVTGTSVVSGQEYDFATVKFDSGGSQLWVATFDGSAHGYDVPYDIEVTPSGSAYVVGTSEPGGFTTINYDSNGGAAWIAILDDRGMTGAARALALDSSGAVYVAGSLDRGASGTDFATVKYTPGGTEIWRSYFDGSGDDDTARALTLDEAGGVIVTGDSRSASDRDFATVKYDPSGLQVWAAIHDGPGHSEDISYSLAADPSGNVYVTGSEGAPTSSCCTDYATIKYDNAGAKQWVATFNGTGDWFDAAHGLAVTSAGTIFVVGTASTIDDFTEVTTLRYDSAGGLLSTLTPPPIGAPEYLGERKRTGSATAVDSSGYVYLTGSRRSGNGSEILTMKVSPLGEVDWARSHRSARNNYGFGLAIDDLGSVYVAGWSLEGALPQYRVTIKYSNAGTEEWVSTYQGVANGENVPVAIAVDSSRNVLVTGWSRGSTGGINWATVKYDTSGAEKWVSTFSGPGLQTDYPAAIAVDETGSAYVAGTSRDAIGNSNFTTIRYDSDGVQQWVATFDGEAGSTDLMRSLAIDTAGSAYVTGSSMGFDENPDIATVKYDSGGVEQWVAVYDGPSQGSDSPYAIALDIVGNVYVAGESASAETSLDFATIKYGSGGIEQWVATFDGGASGEDTAHEVAVGADGAVFVTGRAWNDSDFDFATVKYDGGGTQQWVVTYDGAAGDDHALDLVLGQARRIYVAGYSTGPDSTSDVLALRIADFEALFSDGFESGDTSAWSSTSPLAP